VEFESSILRSLALGALNKTDEKDHDREFPRGVEKAIREALRKHMTWLSQCTDVIQELVSVNFDSEKIFESLSRLLREHKTNEE
jgi:hypothetical protein